MLQQTSISSVLSSFHAAAVRSFILECQGLPQSGVDIRLVWSWTMRRYLVFNKRSEAPEALSYIPADTIAGV